MLFVMIFSVPMEGYTISLSSNQPNPIWPNLPTDATLTCTVKLNLLVAQSDISLLEVDAQIFREGISLNLTDMQSNGTTFTYTINLGSFGRNDSGNYSCKAMVKPHENSTYLTGNITITDNTKLSTGKKSI